MWINIALYFFENNIFHSNLATRLQNKPVQMKESYCMSLLQNDNRNTLEILYVNSVSHQW